MRKALAIFALTSSLTAACEAACPPPLLDSLLACGKLHDPSERVRCYDTQVATLSAAAAPVVAPMPAAPAATPTATVQQPPAAQFGEEQLPRTLRAEPAQKDEAVLASITAMRTVGERIYLISLSNGQVWRQQGSELTGLFRAGQDARIERGAMGSYHMSIVEFGSKNWVPVTRVK